MQLLSKLLLIAAGGAIGAVLRYLVSGWTYLWAGEGFPWGTMSVNILGSFLLGFLWALSEQVTLDARWSPFVFVGILGAFTTFSTYSLESFNLIRDGELHLGLLNLIGSNLLGLGGVYLGFLGARALLALIR